MVHVIKGIQSHADYGGGDPLVHIHFIERNVFGNGIGIRVYGEVRMAAKEVVFAKELMLNTIQVMLLTPESPAHGPAFTAQKWVYHKGEYDNYASVDIFTHDPSDESIEEMTAGHADAPYNGSLWLNFMVLGE